MNVLIKQNRHLARPKWPAFDLGQKQSITPESKKGFAQQQTPTPPRPPGGH